MSLALWLTGAASAAVLGASARWNWWRPRAEGLPILMYHKIGTPPPDSRLKKLWVSTDMFRRQMEWLKTHRWEPVTLRQVAEKQDRGDPLSPRAVVISFDDGYLNNYQNAFPVLRDYGYPAVVFLVVQAVGWENFWHDPATESRLPMMSWKNAEEMQSAGVEFGSHTMTHPRLTGIESKQVVEELGKSRRIITEFLGREPVTFAYPYGNGQDDEKVRRLVRDAGYRWACSVHQGKSVPTEEPYCLHRIFVRGDDSLFDFHLNMTRGRARL
ncbi:MAG TPA: polysaccharide deacetylase family protein [Elusimicrobiota bacterium]|nr:polysaccharide deacetylase family protein [Elusimicrobiota bacterium]